MRHFWACFHVIQDTVGLQWCYGHYLTGSGSHVVRDVDAANAAELDGAAQASDAVRGADGAVVDRSQGSI